MPTDPRPGNEVPRGWASNHIERLVAGETVQFRPRGNSMRGKVKSGALCTVAPVDAATLRKGDIVLCIVGRAQYLHLIKAVRGDQYQIGNNVGGINGWVTARSIYGRLIEVE